MDSLSVPSQISMSMGLLACLWETFRVIFLAADVDWKNLIDSGVNAHKYARPARHGVITGPGVQQISAE